MAPDDEPKIIVDEDWKARVQREKEEAARKAAESQEQGTGTEEEAEEQSIFSTLIDRLALEGAMALGLVAPKDTKEVMIDLGLAQWIIDVLMDLREKTRNNLEPEEQGKLTATLADLQRVFVLRSQQVHEAMLKNPNLKPKTP